MTPEMSIDVLLKEQRHFPPSEEFRRRAHIRSLQEYERLYLRSVEDPDGFWAEQAKAFLDWSRPWEKVLDWDFHAPRVRWFLGGRLNAAYNCLDRHLATRGQKTALIWESEEGIHKSFTYQQLFDAVNRFAGVLKKQRIRKGDRVAIYLPMIPELPIAMLACARIGAVHNVVFGGFSALALAERIHDSEARLLITADEGVRGGKTVPLKRNTDEAVADSPTVERVIVVRRTGRTVPFTPGRDNWWHEEMAAPDLPSFVEPEAMEANDPLFVLYTSGSTGRPKGVLHATGGYLLHCAVSFRWIFDCHEEDIHFCTADIGWVTGHSYIVYGPLAEGATMLLFEGIPTYPKPDRFWEVVEKHRVSIFYTAPTAIRTLMRESEEWVTRHDLTSLRVLGTVGEPINPEAWIWYHRVVGNGHLPIVDTWWQTETGGILITPLPGAMTLKPGSACRPFPGVVAKVLREDGSEAAIDEGGYLVIDRPWPGMMIGMNNDPGNLRFKEIYFSRFPGRYFTGDGARVDEEGDFWLLGRIDDVLNVSGHRLGTAEIESALVQHPDVAEAAVVGFPHTVKGEGIYAFVTVKEHVQPDERLRG
ncbi:MAG: acetate--CoA ligase, partial [Nitrospirae bacterium]|nr:acetate--CoA ligase [Nitrospirota bacterium]